MGGGVGIGCHGTRTGWSARAARSPCRRCGIGLVPDVGGSSDAGAGAWITWANTWACTCCADGSADDAILAGFADYYHSAGGLARADRRGWRRPAIAPSWWRTPLQVCAAEGKLRLVQRPDTDQAFRQGRDPARPFLRSLAARRQRICTAGALKALNRNGAPLSMACTVEMLQRLRAEGLRRYPPGAGP